MYELIILSLLARKPSHGYLMLKIVNDMIGPFARLSNGRFYPLLAKLEKDGLIEPYQNPAAEAQGERQSRHYRITEEGHSRLHRLMMDVSSNPGEYKTIFLHKAVMLDYLELSERLFLLDHYINYCQAHILHLKAENDDLKLKSADYEIQEVWLNSTINAMEHMSNGWEVELGWARELREKTLARAEGLAAIN